MPAPAPHLLVYISGHGFGHVAQTAPVLNRLREQLPALRLTIWSGVPRATLQNHVRGNFVHIDNAADFGMVMASALDVLADQSLAAYREFHDDWTGKVAGAGARIAALAPDLVLSNVGYLPLAGARHAGVPAAALCSLNWLDVFGHYCGHLPGATQILDDMRVAYAAAAVFLRATPGMDMAALPRIRPVGPIARLGRDVRATLHRRLGLADGERLVLVSMGGIATESPLALWPATPGVRWLVPQSWALDRPDVAALEPLGLDFIDVLKSVDAFVAKPGYGSFAEAACNGIPLLYVSRHDWPEEPCLVHWLGEHGRCAEVSREDFAAGAMSEAQRALWSQPKKDAIEPVGIGEAARLLAAMLDQAALDR
jgi:hypothetical protein